MSDVTQLAPIEPWMLKSLREHVHELLRKAILSGQLKAGEKLNERRLAAELGTSTTPLKEAFRQLEAEGLVRTEARRGSYVIFDARQAEEMTLARAAIESMIARQAAKHITPRSVALLGKTLEQMQEALARADLQGLIALNEAFHDAIYEASGCQYLRRLQSSQRMYDQQTRLLVLAEADERERSFREHTAIFAAIQQRDQDLAEKRMREHVMLAGAKHIDTVFGPQDLGE